MSVVISVRVKPDDMACLEKLCASTDRPTSWHLKEAIRRYLIENQWQTEKPEELTQ